MAEPILHLTGESLTARRGLGGITTSLLGASPAVLNTDQPGINGSTSIDMWRGANANRPIFFPVGANGGNVALSGNISILMRLYFKDVTNRLGLYKQGYGGRAPLYGPTVYFNTGNQLRWYYYDEAGAADAVFSNSPILTADTWSDLFFQYPAVPTTGGNKIWVNGSFDKEQNSVKTVTNPANFLNAILCHIGYYSDSADQSAYYLDELAVWDGLQDPSSVDKRGGGTGSLDGPTRDWYVASTPFDGANNTWPDENQVRETITWYEANVLKTGTLVLPAVGNVKTGTLFGSDGTELTGTRDDALPAKVLADESYGEDGDEISGTVILPALGDVESGVAYGPGSTSSGTLVVPAASDVKFGEGFGAGGIEFIGSYVPVTPPDDILMIDLEKDIEDIVVIMDSQIENDDLTVIIEDDPILVFIEEKLESYL